MKRAFLNKKIDGEGGLYGSEKKACYYWIIDLLIVNFTENSEKVVRVKFREITYLAKFFWNIQSPTLQSLVLIFIIHFDILLHKSKLYDFRHFESNVQTNWDDDLEDDNVM